MKVYFNVFKVYFNVFKVYFNVFKVYFNVFKVYFNVFKVYFNVFKVYFNVPFRDSIGLVLLSLSLSLSLASGALAGRCFSDRKPRRSPAGRTRAQQRARRAQHACMRTALIFYNRLWCNRSVRLRRVSLSRSLSL